MIVSGNLVSYIASLENMFCSESRVSFGPTFVPNTVIDPKPRQKQEIQQFTKMFQHKMLKNG